MTERPSWRALFGLYIAFCLLAWLALPFVGDFHGVIDHRHNLVVQANARHTLLEYGQLPLWNPYAKGGFTGLGAMEDGTFFPTFALTLAFDVFVGVVLEYILFSGALALGLFVLAGRLGASRAGSLVAGCAGLFSSTLPVYLVGGWGMHFTMALIPWVWVAWLSPRRAGDVAAAILLALFFLRGGMYPLAYVVMSLGILTLVETIRERTPRATLRLLRIGVLSIGLCAVKLVPTLVDGDMGTARGTEGYCFNLKGLLVGLTTWQLNGSHFEGVGAIGPVAVVLAIFGARRGGSALASVAGFFALYALGSNLTPARWFEGSNQMHVCDPGASLHDVIEWLPGLESLWNPSRALVPLGMIVAVWAALGFDRLTVTLRHRRRWLALATLGTVLAITIPAYRSTGHTLHNQMHPLTWPADPPENAPFTQRSSCGRNDAFCPVMCSGSARSATFPFHPTPEALRVVGDPDYVGEAYWLADDGSAGEARLVEWSPNEMVWDTPGAGRLVVNQRFHPAWTVRDDSGDARPAGPYRGLLSAETTGGRLILRFRPTSFWWGLVVSLLSVVVMVAWARRPDRVYSAAETRGGITR